MTGLLLIGRPEGRVTASVNSRVINFIERYGRAFGTVTADSGTEFHNHERIEARTKAVFYFAKPYHSWVGGSNKNATGLTRQNLPKYTSMSGLSQHQGTAITGKLTTQPHKRFGRKTPLQYFNDPQSVLRFKLAVRRRRAKVGATP